MQLQQFNPKPLVFGINAFQIRNKHQINLILKDAYEVLVSNNRILSSLQHEQ